MVKVKICGITSLEDALAVAEAGADALGFNFYQKSPRYIEPSVAQSIIELLPPFIATIGVFVNESDPVEVGQIASQIKLSAIQLHGNESPDYCAQLYDWRIIKALHVGENFRPEQVGHYTVASILLDAFKPGQFGGTGEAFDWEAARAAKEYGRIILAGGLTPENVAEAINIAQPDGVDVASGVEHSPGRKDLKKVRQFIARAKGMASAAN